MLRVIIDPARSQKDLQVAQQMSNDEQHQNHADERDDHFLADGGAIKRGESGHEQIRLAFLFSRSITISGQHVRWAHRLPACVPLGPRCGTQTFSLCARRSFTPLTAGKPDQVSDMCLTDPFLKPSRSAERDPRLLCSRGPHLNPLPQGEEDAAAPGAGKRTPPRHAV